MTTKQTESDNGSNLSGFSANQEVPEQQGKKVINPKTGMTQEQEEHWCNQLNSTRKNSAGEKYCMF